MHWLAAFKDPGLLPGGQVRRTAMSRHSRGQTHVAGVVPRAPEEMGKQRL